MSDHGDLNPAKTKAAGNCLLYFVLFVVFVLSVWVTVYNMNFTLEF